MKRLGLISAVVVLGAGLASSCSAPQSKPATPVTTPPATASPATAPASATVQAGPSSGVIPWAQLTHDERLTRMKTVVKPQMETAFQTFDPVKFKGFGCMTCHGDRMMSGDFSMPNPALPPLPTTEDGFKKLAADKPGITNFMMNTVKPQMVQILGVPSWEPSSPTGFGCYGCHPMEK